MSKVVIIGGGTAGISSAAMLKRFRPNLNIIIIDPAKYHYYQPMWTLVGGGITPKEISQKEMKNLIPKGVKFIQDAASEFCPDENIVKLKSGEQIDYDYLVVCPGIQLDWQKIEGLEETLGKNGVCSNYSYETVDSTWQAIQSTKKGNALFTYPNTPIKCGGAPQKIMYLAEEHFRKAGVRDSISVQFVTAGDKIFGVQKYREVLEKIVHDRNIKPCFKHNLEKIDGPNKKAYFRNLETNELLEKEFEMIHVTPPMSAPEFLKGSPISNEDGWVDVDKYTTQHVKYKNIFSIGDASSLPTSKTGAAIRKESPVMVKNMIAYMEGKELKEKYSGYTSCPLVTGRGKVIMAEFDYDGNPDETFPFDQSKERYSMYLAKRYAIPFMYWHGMMHGYM